MNTIIDLLKQAGIEASWNTEGWIELPVKGGTLAIGTIKGFWAADAEVNGKSTLTETQMHIDSPPEELVAWIKGIAGGLR